MTDQTSMTLNVTRFAPENVSSAEASKILQLTEGVSYELEYFEVSAVGGVPRDILAYGGADWKDKAMTWPSHLTSPFGCYPVLHLHHPHHPSLCISETFILEHFLAKRFHLLGDNEFEEQTIKMFHSSSFFLRERLAIKVTWNYKQVMDQALETFLSTTLPTWIQVHSTHLKRNGSNGHYVGEKLSLADLQTANNLDHMQFLKGGDKMLEMVKRTGPEIWKVKEKVDQEPRLQKWRQSEEYRKHLKTSEAMYANTGI